MSNLDPDDLRTGFLTIGMRKKTGYHPTARLTDQRETPSYRDARTHLSYIYVPAVSKIYSCNCHYLRLINRGRLIIGIGMIQFRRHLYYFSFVLTTKPSPILVLLPLVSS